MPKILRSTFRICRSAIIWPATIPRFFSNWHVHEMVLERLGLDYTYSQLSNMVSVTNPQDTRIFVAVQSSDPEEAKDLADTYAQVACEFIAVKNGHRAAEHLLKRRCCPAGRLRRIKAKNVLLGFVIGLVLSCGIIVVQFLMDDRLRSADDIEKYVQLRPRLA